MHTRGLQDRTDCGEKQDHVMLTAVSELTQTETGGTSGAVSVFSVCL